MKNEHEEKSKELFHMIFPESIKIIRERYAQSEGLRKITHNTGWLFFDKILRMGVGLIVGVWVARYLGPEEYGMWNYSMAFATLFATLATLGLDGIVVRDLIKDSSKSDIVLGTAFVLKLFAGIATFIITVIAISFIKQGDRLMLSLVALSSLGFVFQSFFVIDFYFQAHIISKYTVYAQNAAFLIIAFVKIGLLLYHAPLITFAAAGTLEIFLTSIFLILAYRNNKLHIRAWKYEWTTAKRLLEDSWPLILGGIAVMIYMRIDQVMIGEMLGDAEVGIYSAAIRISEIWYFIPMSIAASLFPALVESKKQSEEFYTRRLQKLYDFMAFIGIIVAIAMTFLSASIIHVLFGDVYSQSATVLSIHIWIGVTICISTVHSKWLLIEGLQRYGLIYTAIGAVVNVGFNLIFIRTYGVNGAALSTLLAQYVPWIAMFFLPKARKNGLCMLKSLFIIFRIKSLSIR